jgi:twitching motility protein PilI
MAEKLAKHELQARLAEKVAQARARTDVVQSFLAVECRGLGVLLPLEQAGEIHAWTQPAIVPHTRSWFAGVVNLRGGLFGVVDLGAFLGLPTGAGPGLSKDQARLVALNPAFGVNVALGIDRLAGLKRADALKESTPTHGESRPGFAGREWADSDGRTWQEIKMSELVVDEQFLGVAA